MSETLDVPLFLEISRRFEAPPERVFDAWVTPLWAQWLPPAGAQCELVAMDARVGGRYHLRAAMPDGRIVDIEGEYQEIDRPDRLVLSWGGGCLGHETVITLSFRRDGAGTMMTLRQVGFGNSDGRDRHNTGWTGPGGSFDKLAQVLAA